ncbi:MAG: hypothetical protein JWL90_1761 [Chthoniobacteraceae bacterium]|nr:hypothetical protein [Chthoniobacteraceae bacterium]
MANLSAALLGFPSVPGSLMIPELKKPLTIIHGTNTATISWPLYLTGYTLETTDELATGTWTTVSSGVIESDNQNTYTILSPSRVRFFRLRKPIDPAFSPLKASIRTGKQLSR